MKALITYASEFCSNKKSRLIEINTINELVNLMKKEHHNVIISRSVNVYLNDPPDFKTAEIEIEIYDDYVE